MRAYARRYGEDEERWAVTGLVHDLDYERFPDLDEPENGHPRSALHAFVRARLARGRDRRGRRACDVSRGPAETRMAKALFAVDELSGFIAACALVRPTGIEGMKPKSVRKKLQAAVVRRRGQPRRGPPGAEELGVDFDQHVAFVIEAMGERSEALGLGLAEPTDG